MTGSIARHLAGRPLALECGALDALLGMHPRANLDALLAHLDGALDVVDGVAVVRVHGPLFRGRAERVAGEVERAVGDPTVRAVLLDVDSPGGVVAGMLDAARRIRAAARQKPVWAIANDACYSAAYAIASGAGRLLVTETAGVGSVGVAYVHVETSKLNEAAGITVTPIYSGERKVDLADFAPLSREAHERAQAEVDRVRDLFVDVVARHRGMSDDAVRGTEAATYHGPGAVAVGFADAVSSIDDALAELAGRAAAPPPPPEPEPEAPAADAATWDSLAAAAYRRA